MEAWPQARPNRRARRRPKILFTGYAPVHFVCFKPIYDALAATREVELYVSGGLRERMPGGALRHDAEALYAPFDLPAGTVLSIEEIAELDVDFLFCAN